MGSANVTGAYKRISASVIYPDAPKYLAAEKAKDIYILKDVSNDTNKEGDIYETPLEIYNYIRTHISSNLGIKCRRSSEEVMNSGRATASENAALLVKMLRDKGYEAKYVYGQAILKADKASWMTGATSIEKAAEIYKENGIKYIKLTSGGSTVGLIVDHIWVRAYLPMSDYRGAKNNSGEYAWVDLDTYVKEHNLSSVEPLKVLPFSLQYETRGLNGSGEPKVLDELPEEVKVKDTEPSKEDDNDDISENTNGLTVLFTSPESEDALTAPTDIVGTASSDTGKIEYTLGYRPEGKGDFIEFAKGDKNVNSSTLGKFDPTLLANGRYQIRLTAKDDKGNTKKLTRVVNVEGALKVGNYHIGFTDITANLAGTTVNVNRIYDSSVKESGDFGYGWSMSVQGLKIFENASLADGYKMVQTGSGFSTRYQMTETKNHDVTVTYGDGTSDRFELVFFPAMGVLRPIQEIEQLGYKCVTNQKVRLEILTDTSGTVSGGTILFYENGVYDTINYRLTTENGEKLYINKNKGVYKIEDSSGDIITVDDDGYHAANGKSIEFKRDKENRVTEATDPLGNTTTYKYNNAGDLISVTDSADRTVTYTYDKYHNLVSITDPMGIAVSRNEYDDEGRLIATIDADGNRMEFDHNVDGRQEVVKDRRGNSTAYTYDERGNVIQTKDALGNITKNTYDANNNCIETTDANGHTTKYAYDANGNVTKVTAADGTVVESTYSEENYVTGIKMLDKTVMAMTYANNGALTSVSDANGNKTEYEYSADGKLTGMTDAIGVYQKMTYDPEGNVVSTTNGAGESACYTYDDQNRCSSVTIKRNEDGKEISFTSRYTYDDADNITQSVDNAGNVTTYEYDANGNQIASVDSKNRRISYEYDHQANLVKTIYPDGTSESFEYDANGNNISATDRSGLKVTMEYDKLDRMISKTYADGNKESYAYDAVGNVIEQVSVTGAKTTYVYDECNRNTSIKDPLGYTTKFTYDAQSKLTSRMDAKNNKTTYVYDDNGNIIKTTYPDGGVVSAQYDARNRVISQTDQRGYTTKYEYDGADKLTKVTDHLKNSYVYTYDANGNLVKVTDPLNHSTQYTYDAVGHVQSVKNAAGKAAEYDYDSTGKLVCEKDFAGHETKYSYDDMDRVVSKKTADNDISYTYTEDGLLSSVKDKNGTVGYKYDKFNRLTSYTDAKNITVSYEYDQFGNIASIDNGFKKTNYEYDKLNRLTRVIDHNGNATVYEYDVLGNRSAVRYPNGNVMSYTYDACQRLKTEIIKDSSGKQIFKCNYNLGRCGERLNVYDEELSAETDAEGKQQVIKTSITYSYDSLLRLTREDISRGTSR
ncbi:MAG: hypothetical protein IKS48_04090, partial [Eubacterium sp.]|nr:hypothetical protein [Eubacterium sp.]